MDWFNNIKDFLGTPQGQVTVVVSLLVTIATIILNHAVPAFGKFIWHLPKHIKHGWMKYSRLLREWNYWRQFGPKYAIINHGKVVVEESGNTYRISMSITLRFQKRDTLNTMLIECGSMHMTIMPRGLKGRTTNYCLTYSVGTSSCRFISSNPAESMYTLNVFSEIKPTLGETALCDKIYLGTAHIQGISRALKAKHFPVDVDWSKVNPTANPAK